MVFLASKIQAQSFPLRYSVSSMFATLSAQPCPGLTLFAPEESCGKTHAVFYRFYMCVYMYILLLKDVRLYIHACQSVYLAAGKVESRSWCMVAPLLLHMPSIELLYSSTLLIYFTHLLYSFTLLIYFINLLYSSTLLIYFTHLLYSFTLLAYEVAL